mgnify:CR=1 FL=1
MEKKKVENKMGKRGGKNKMEKNIVLGIIGIVVVAAVLFNLNSFTGNVAKSVGTLLLTIKNPNVMQGYNLEINAKNVGTTQEFKIFKESGGVYTGKRFFVRATRCKQQNNGMYECDASFRIPPTLNLGRYYVQAKDMRTGGLIGNKALFSGSISSYDSNYQKTGRK